MPGAAVGVRGAAALAEILLSHGALIKKWNRR
jgi:hypothetical protein